MAFEFTPAQDRAINERGGAILVSAAAGSGKTRVLTERLLRRVTDPDAPTDIDRFLVITYTRAAAAELRGRIMLSLAERAAAHPEDRRLRRQQNLCCRAHIGTIHSFCTDVLRENCHLLGLPPGFTVSDEERSTALRAATLTKLLEQRYERIDADPAFRLLADTVGAGRDDRRLEGAVLRLHDRLRALPDPEGWAETQKAALRCPDVSDAGETLWGRELLSGAREEAVEYLARMEGALAAMQAAGGAIEKAYGPSFTATTEALRDFLRALDQGWDRARDFCAIPFPRLGALRNYPDEALKNAVTETRTACRSALEKLSETFAADSAALLRDLQATAPAMEALLDLALELDAAFRAEKLRRETLDFSDLEQYAARLLTDSAGNPTPAAAELSRRFTEVMVDEYQDVSPIQDRIIRAVSRQGDNLFLVGDVKQSIYRFRLADPGLFLDKYERYSPEDSPPAGVPRRILLRENFRSRAAVLDAANTVFSALMSKALGELDYDDSAALRFGARGYPEGTDTPVEFCVVDAGAGGEIAEDALPPEKNELEARFVASAIKRMVRAGTPVYGPEGSRPCTWEDFVILLRSPGARGAVFRRVLTEEGIPVTGVGGGGFFTSLEITVAVNLLSLTDNPHADVPLISVLRSPVFGFTPDELSAIRAGQPDGDFYAALRSAAETDAHCAGFLALLDSWRALAPDLTPDALLWRVCADTDLFAVCAAMRDGEARTARLTLLLDYARSYADSGFQGLYRFLTWLRNLAERGTEPELPGDGGGAVRILSIHRSKGLEFPFVFLCDLNHRFNKSDTADSVLLHADLGLGPKLVDTDRGIEYPTLARRAIARRMVTELLSEELRVLYVGMTRARERLILTATASDAAEKLARLRASDPAAPLSPVLLRAAPSPARWLALAALCSQGQIPVRVIDALSDTAAEPAETPETAAETDAAQEQLRRNLSFTYPCAGSVGLPSRLTATELKGNGETDPDAASLTPEEVTYTFRPVELGAPRRLSATERGIATHSFLQYLDFSRTDSPEDLRRELDRVRAAGHLRPEEADAVDLAAVAKLFASPLGRAMRSAADLRREFRFTLLTEAADYAPGAVPGDQMLLQGVVDCFFTENGAVTVVDYKTDRVTADTAPARAEHYRGQLKTYAAALERILGLPVGRCVLWFLRPGVEIELTGVCDGSRG